MRTENSLLLNKWLGSTRDAKPLIQSLANSHKRTRQHILPKTNWAGNMIYIYENATRMK